MIVGSQREHTGSECDRLAVRIGFSIVTKIESDITLSFGERLSL